MNNMRNSITLIGKLGRDPETKTFDSGSTATRISLATNETFTNNKGEEATETQWHNCVAWGKMGETMGTYLKKGKEVAVRGKLVHRSYEDKEGVKRNYSEVVINDFTLFGASKPDK